MTVDTVFYLTSLNVFNSLGSVHSNSTSLRVWHQALRPKHTTQTTNLSHHHWSSDDNVEVQVTVLNLFYQVICADFVSTGSLSCFSLWAFSKYDNLYRLTSTVWQND